MRGLAKEKQHTERQDKIVEFISMVYMDGCRRAKQEDYSAEMHQMEIVRMMKKQSISLGSMGQYLGYCKNQVVEDIMEVASDMRKVWRNAEKYQERFVRRSRMHFGGQHYKNLQQDRDQKPTKKVLKMYENQPFVWNQEKQKHFKQAVYPNCVYLMGLSKGNGVIIQNNTLVSCAHVFVEDKKNRIMKLRCFSTGAGQFGIARLQENGLYKQQDICFAQIIKFEALPTRQAITLRPIQAIKFSQEFKPLQCLQVGLLYIPDESILETFQTAEGFIERNQYRNEQDMDLDQEMGKLIHNCFGMWGTSGSPLWDSQGNLIGLHNAWNSQGHNISMLVHDDDQDQCRAIRQYERRAVSVHAIHKLYKEWKDIKNNLLNQSEFRKPTKTKSKMIKKIRNS